MTDTSIIQQARDALAKWREGATTGTPWVFEPGDSVGEYYGGWVYADESGSATIASDLFPDANARLIVGTAGNSKLLDAIDGLLGGVQQMEAQIVMSGWAGMVEAAERIAAAIIAANERMNA